MRRSLTFKHSISSYWWDSPRGGICVSDLDKLIHVPLTAKKLHITLSTSPREGAHVLGPCRIRSEMTVYSFYPRCRLSVDGARSGLLLGRDISNYLRALMMENTDFWLSFEYET